MILPRRGQVTDSSPRALSLDVLGERFGVLEGQVRSFEAQRQVVAPPDEHVAGEPGRRLGEDDDVLVTRDPAAAPVPCGTGNT